MKIINPSAEIIEDQLSQLSIYQRIAYVAGVCYQREPRKTEEEAQAFCRRMVEIGHHSTLEMAVVHIAIPHWCIPPNNKYMHVSQLSGDKFVVTGSVRAMKEAYKPFDVQAFLAGELPVFFGIPYGTSRDFDSMEGIRFAEPHEIPWQHRHVAVRFIVNRAVSHELVRHRPMSFLQESQRYCRYEDDVVFIRPEWVHKKNLDKDTASFTWRLSVQAGAVAYGDLLQQGFTPQQARAVLPNSTKTELIAYASLPQWRHMFNLRCSTAADPEMRKVMIPLRDEFRGKYPEMWGE
jgi:thymidylate synthase (FAD)